jgi:hypothetical protein
VDDEMMTLEEIQAKLDDEAALWEAEGIGINQTSHTNESIFVLKQQSQAILNVLIKSGLITEEQINIEFKTIMYNSMVELRESFLASRRQQVEQMIGAPKIALPDHRLIGPDGQEIKL